MRFRRGRFHSSPSIAHLFQFVHQSRQPSQTFQVAAPLVGDPDEAMEGVVHAVVEVRGRGKSSPDREKWSGSLFVFLL